MPSVSGNLVSAGCLNYIYIYIYIYVKSGGVRFHRIRDLQQYYFNSIQPTSHSRRRSYVCVYIYIYIYITYCYHHITMTTYIYIYIYIMYNPAGANPNDEKSVVVLVAVLVFALVLSLVLRGGRVLLTEILLPRIARQGAVCLISIRG